MEKTLVVMAAGMGSRFGGLKQIEPVGPNKEFIIDYSVYDAKRAGFEKVVFVIKKEMEEIFKETIGRRLENKIKVAYAFQEIEDIPSKKYLAEKRTKPWGTVQAVLCTKDYVDGDFVVINADDFYGYDAYLQASKFLDEEKNDHVYASITFPYIKTASLFGSVKRAVCFVHDGMISELVESKITTKDGYALAEPLSGEEAFSISLDQEVSMNVFAFKHTFYQYLEEAFREYFLHDDEYILANEALLPDVIEKNIKNGKIILRNVPTTSSWFGVTYKEDLEGLKKSIEELIKKGEYPNKLWE